MEFTAEMSAGLLGGTLVGDKSTAVHTVSSIDGGKKGALARKFTIFDKLHKNHLM